MQIHELTKRLKTNEGILDTVKDGISAIKTGYKQGGLKGAAKASISNTAMAQAGQQRLQKQSAKGLQDLKAKGINAKTPLSFYMDQVKQDPQATQQRQALDTEFTQDFELGPALPDDANHALMVQTQNGGTYYKDIKGTWYNEEGKALPPTSNKSLDDLIDADQYSQVATPPALQKTPAASTKGAVPKTAAPPPPAPAAPVQEAVVPGNLAQRAQQRNTPAQPAQAQQPAATGQKPRRSQGKKKLRKDFDAWISQSVPNYSKIANDAEVDKALKQIFNQLLANKNDPKAAAQLFDKYVLTIQAGILRAKQGGQGEPGATNDTGSTTDAELARLRGQPAKRTGNKELDNILSQAGIQLSEGQVFITKDIRVKTAKGDYVKRHEDQQWYDPNGVLIDPVKYADYVKKLDATPQAQTRYQADAEKELGSDTGVLKARKELANQPKAAPKIELPQATAADWEQARAHRNDMNNAAIDKTVNDLRNAEYFNTGQKDYLQQQLAQLMAKKF